MASALAVLACLALPALGADPPQEGRRASTISGDHFWANFKDVTKAFWIFSETGVHVYSQDGASLVTSTPATDVCGAATCTWYDAKSDGQRYVLATSYNNGKSRVEAFSIMGGYHVGSIPTCQHGFEIDLAPYREEAWVHCWTPSGDLGDAGHVDVFSTGALLLDHTEFNIDGSEVDGAHSHGQVHVDSAYPNYAFAARRDSPALRKLNIHTRDVTHIWTNGTGPAAACHGYEWMAFSGHNKHVFARCNVCCSCGVGEDTNAACPTNGVGNVTLPDGSEVWGTCTSCYGSSRDTVGVVEIDAVTETVLGSHYRGSAAGGSAIPEVSPSGELIVLIDNSGAVAQVLKSLGNGVLSNDLAASDVPLGFAAAGRYDVAFIEDASYSMLIFSSTHDDFLVLADLAEVRAAGTVTPRSLPLTHSSTSGFRNRFGGRALAWGQGSKYAFVSSDANDAVEVIDLGTGPISGVSVSRTITSQPSFLMVYVDDYYGQRFRGPTGEAGAAGQDGATGAPGAPGAPGAQGMAGARGAQGAAGAAGRDGAKGKDGEDAATAVPLAVAAVAAALAIASLAVACCTVKKLKDLLGSGGSKVPPQLVGARL